MHHKTYVYRAVLAAEDGYASISVHVERAAYIEHQNTYLIPWLLPQVGKKETDEARSLCQAELNKTHVNFHLTRVLPTPQLMRSFYRSCQPWYKSASLCHIQQHCHRHDCCNYDMLIFSPPLCADEPERHPHIAGTMPGRSHPWLLRCCNKACRIPWHWYLLWMYVWGWFPKTQYLDFILIRLFLTWEDRMLPESSLLHVLVLHARHPQRTRKKCGEGFAGKQSSITRFSVPTMTALLL